MASGVFLGAARIFGPPACGRVLLVGETNPRSTDPRYALYHRPANSAGHRLQSRILAVHPRRTYLSMWRTNLCLGDWDPGSAAERAAELVRRALPWRTVVALGVRVSGALGAALGVSLETFGDPHVFPGDLRVVSIPHPSGLNLAWNEPSEAERARSLLRLAEPDVPWGELAS